MFGVLGNQLKNIRYCSRLLHSLWCGKSVLAWYDYSISKRKDAEW